MGIAIVILVALGGLASLITMFMNGVNATKKDFRNMVIQGQFASLGNVVGLTKEEIIAQVGLPTHTSFHDADGSLLQWITANYHIALLFRGEICQGISHESSVT